MAVQSPVLVVEDNNINREVAILSLKRMGLEAALAVDGFAALELVKSRPFALILMDVMMPSMDGWEAARSIRELEKPLGRHTPIIGVSAWSGTDNRAKCLESGMDDFLMKPYDFAALKAVVDRWIPVESRS